MITKPAGIGQGKVPEYKADKDAYNNDEDILNKVLCFHGIIDFVHPANSDEASQEHFTAVHQTQVKPAGAKHILLMSVTRAVILI